MLTCGLYATHEQVLFPHTDCSKHSKMLLLVEVFPYTAYSKFVQPGFDSNCSLFLLWTASLSHIFAPTSYPPETLALSPSANKQISDEVVIAPIDELNPGFGSHVLDPFFRRRESREKRSDHPDRDCNPGVILLPLRTILHLALAA